MNAAVVTGVHGAGLRQVRGVMGGRLRSGIVGLFFFLEGVQPIPSPQPNAEQNGQQKNENFQRLRPKTTSTTKREPA